MAKNEQIIAVATLILLAAEGEQSQPSITRHLNRITGEDRIEHILFSNAEDEYWVRFVMAMLEGDSWLIDERAGSASFSKAEEFAAMLGGTIEFENLPNDEKFQSGLSVKFRPSPP